MSWVKGAQYELRNQGRLTAYQVTYKVPMERFSEGQDIKWSEDGVAERLPLDMPGESSIFIVSFRIMGEPDPRIYVWWHDRRGRRHEWNTELPPVK